ncbi:hypothetical protein [Roseateles amylovorans]|uniref:Uncharacterized protein n=1 Tax=Roseateles amylovorans TaxID=2978473 RepID=A0ABY6B6Z0_9BURK|nr:hypothetical protein [Roseateles amylovorans]UXH78980.1 hypothetical protein N4261_03315 [Roseateles amylovorans]
MSGLGTVGVVNVIKAFRPAADKDSMKAFSPRSPLLPSILPAGRLARAMYRSVARAWRPGLLAGAALLSGCDQLGIEDPAKIAAAKEADSKAIGGACRNALRAIEDCYALNPKAQKAAVYEGWREMDEYMRENKLEGTRPLVANPNAGKPSEPASEADEEPANPTKSSGKTGR